MVTVCWWRDGVRTVWTVRTWGCWRSSAAAEQRPDWRWQSPVGASSRDINIHQQPQYHSRLQPGYRNATTNWRGFLDFLSKRNIKSFQKLERALCINLSFCDFSKIKDNSVYLHKRLPTELLVSIEDFKKILKLRKLLQEF